MAVKQIRFTKAALEAIKPPIKPEGAKGGVYDTYKDTGEKGLVLLVSHGGAKSFYLYKKFQGRPERFKIGTFPDYSIENARKKARSGKALMDDGINPASEWGSVKGDMTLGVFFDLHYLEHAKVHKRSWKQDEDNFNRQLSGLKHKPLGAIKQQDIETLHQKITKASGSYIANRMLALISTVFNHAIQKHRWKGENPAYGIEKNKEQSRDRFLSGDELARFFKAVMDEPNEIARCFFLLSLFCGQRRSNVLAMRWDQIDFSNGLWLIPMTKNGESQTVSLTAPALQLLQEMQQKAEKGVPWVFPSASSASGHMEEPKSAWKRILQRAKIENLRIHDLRRTHGSYLAMGGASQYIIGAALGHKSSAATAIYARLSIDPVKEAQEQAAKRMVQLMEGK
jgi:integrase